MHMCEATSKRNKQSHKLIGPVVVPVHIFAKITWGKINMYANSNIHFLLYIIIAGDIGTVYIYSMIKFC